MRASAFELRYRFWIIAGLFGLAFSAYSLDPVNAAAGLLRAFAGPGEVPRAVVLLPLWKRLAARA